MALPLAYAKMFPVHRFTSVGTDKLYPFAILGGEALSVQWVFIYIERIDTFEDFQYLRTAWDALYHADPEAQFFLSWKWLTGPLESYPEEWMVLVARSAEGTALGLLPLRLKTLWSKSRQKLRNELHFAGRLFWADYGGILCHPDHEELVLGTCAAYLKQMHWSHIFLKGFRTSARRFELFMKPFMDERLLVESLTSVINDGETDNLLCPYIDLPDTFAAYLAQLSSNTRQKISRFLRKLESSSEYRITTTDVTTHSRDVQILTMLWSNMWGEQKGADTQRLAAKYGKIIQRGLEDELAHLLVLWHREKPIGVLASFVDWEYSRLLFFVSGRDENFRDLPVGLVLRAWNIRWTIEHGLRTYDFLRGNEPYKYSLGAADVRVQYPAIRTKSGTNLNDKLDPGCITEALSLADDFVRRGRQQRAITACQQILATIPEHQAAMRLLRSLEFLPQSPAAKQPRLPFARE
ncbi:MAG: GNAT family N-acetyltransferase [Deltaproteobacteria bacterium]|nr:GNAT family N-acetyltransferase [Deltaproteobacteria bacterium]